MKITIAKVIALQSLATEPGQQIAMTASAMRWVRVGLVMKYGSWEAVPSNYQETFRHDRELWQMAMLNYGKGDEYWPHALLPCQDIADDMAEIAAVNDMLDYRQVDYNFTVATFGPSAYDVEEEEAKQKKEELAANPPHAHTHNTMRRGGA
jgi:hypothetical protein